MVDKNCCPTCGQKLPKLVGWVIPPRAIGLDQRGYDVRLLWNDDDDCGATVGQEKAPSAASLATAVKKYVAERDSDAKGIAEFLAVELAAKELASSTGAERGSCEWMWESDSAARKAKTVLLRRANELLNAALAAASK